MEIRVPIIKSKKKMFDPYYQKRADALKDISKKEKDKDKEKLDKMFGIKRG